MIFIKSNLDNIPEEKKAFINDFVQKPLIARIATADGSGQPHVVPVWYGWDCTNLWISSFSNTRKINDLEENLKIAVTIDVAGEKGETKAVVFEGVSTLVREPRDFLAEQTLWICERYLGKEGAQEKDPQSWIKESHNLLIKLTPDAIFTWHW